MADKLPPGAVTQPVTSSFPTVLATPQHVYAADKYHFIDMKGGHIEPQAVEKSETYDALKRDWDSLHQELIAWAKENLAAKKEVLLDGWGVWPTWMLVMQIANHATHHFGPVLTLLRQLGYTPQQFELTDLISYYLWRFPPPNQKERVKSFLDTLA